MAFEVIFLVVLALVWITYASIQDLRMREVANWLNFSLIIFALGFRFFWSLFSESGFGFFYQGLIGFGIFLILGNLFYYGRLFAGGDAKLMIALGTILPFSESFSFNLNIFVWFFGLFIFVGAIYGFLWSIVLAVRNYKGFKKEFVKLFNSNRKIILSLMIIGLILWFFGFVHFSLIYLGIFVFISPYFYLLAKSIDNCCMIVEVPVGKLREGDWLHEDLKLSGGKVIRKKWDGLNKDQIKLIRKKFKKVKIKQGIAFVPVFLISFLILIGLYFNGYI